ncbi:uncharacterized protein BDV14DRAFT_201438 [Aspergillus stella-maris]|uniref:uncharacterized protein n=1 Tax=Aspergillus stella-maris TaxID=1810926 RepID=UPI003CCDAC35
MSSQQGLLWLCLVRYMHGLGNAGRWCLVVCQDGEPGLVYELKSNGRDLTYEPPTELTNLYPSYPWTMFVLGDLADEHHAIVKDVIAGTPPPVSPELPVNKATQFWVLQVIEELVKQNIVWSFRFEEAMSMMNDEPDGFESQNPLKR